MNFLRASLTCWALACAVAWAPRLQAERSSFYFEDPSLLRIANAIETNDPKELKSLLNEIADVNKAGRDGMTLLAWAMARDNKEAFHALLELKANPNVIAEAIPDRGRTLLSLGARLDNTYWLTELLQHGGDPNLKTEFLLRTPVFFAIGSAKTATAKLLIEHGANLNYADPFGETPLLNAAELNQYQMVYAMLEKGADYTVKTKAGNRLGDYISMYERRPKVDKSTELWTWKNKVVAWLATKKVDLPSLMKGPDSPR